MFLNAVFKICSPGQRENVGNCTTLRGWEDPCVLLRTKAEWASEYIKRKTDHFLLSKVINILQLPVLKSVQVFIGSATATQSGVLKEEIPVFQVVLFACPSSPNSHPVHTSTAVTPWISGVAVVCFYTGCPSHEALKGFFPLKASGSDPPRVILRCVPGFLWCMGPWSRACTFATSSANWSALYFKMHFLSR